MKKLKIALIGAGFIADYHARALQKLANVSMVAVAALPLPAAQKFAAKYNIPDATDKALELPDRSDIDAVVIGTPDIRYRAISALASDTR